MITDLVKGVRKITITHNFTTAQSRNGWSIVSFDFISNAKVSVKAYGLKEVSFGHPVDKAYLKDNELMVISLPDGDVLYQIDRINYEREPHNLFSAELSYIQHLTGFKVISLREPQQRERAMAWSGGDKAPVDITNT